jgi:hypothetical protein
MAEWQIQKGPGQCCGTGKEFEEGQEYVSALVETEDGFERRDYSLEYWESEGPDVYCFWKRRFEKEPENKKLLVDDDMLVAFFERLEGESEEEKVNFRFVLMLILMRKRILRYESSIVKDGLEVWELKQRGLDELVEVVNPHLNEEQIEELSGQMGKILNVDF